MPLSLATGNSPSIYMNSWFHKIEMNPLQIRWNSQEWVLSLFTIFLDSPNPETATQRLHAFIFYVMNIKTNFLLSYSLKCVLHVGDLALMASHEEEFIFFFQHYFLSEGATLASFTADFIIPLVKAAGPDKMFSLFNGVEEQLVQEFSLDDFATWPSWISRKGTRGFSTSCSLTTLRSRWGKILEWGFLVYNNRALLTVATTTIACVQHKA
ncbi:hypothetical protein ACJX0J_005346 [Zea mays]